jgi:hypothetical protein
MGPGGQCEGAKVVHQEDNAGNVINLTIHVTLPLP